MKVVIVTGGIGSGKSQACRILEERYEIPVYEADKRAKSLYSEIPGMLDAIEDALGCGLRNDAGEFAPQMLAAVIFNDASALKKVEEILFPAMTSDFEIWAEGKGQAVVFESATVLEKPQFDGFGDIVLLIDAPLSVRIERAAARDCADPAKILQRIAAQPLMNRLSEGESDPRIDFVIKNDSTIENLSEKLGEFVEKYGLTKMLL